MTVSFHEHPIISWLLRHLLLEHHVEIDDFDGRLNEYIVGYHDGLHGFVDSMEGHDGYEAAKKQRDEWLMEQIQIWPKR